MVTQQKLQGQTDILGVCRLSVVEGVTNKRTCYSSNIINCECGSLSGEPRKFGAQEVQHHIEVSTLKGRHSTLD